MPSSAFDNSYARLPARFYSRTDPAPVAAPRLIKFNAALAAELGIGLDAADPEQIAHSLSGNRQLPGSEPLAMAYAGHQFGHFVPQLGDGRAILLGELRDRAGVLRDVQLKGSGRTPYSRGGDGRAALGPVLREYIVSEAMTALGIPSTRTLAAVLSGERVLREAPLPGAILTRVAASHVRVGTFQYFAARGDADAVRTLADYVIARHYPELKVSPAPYLELLSGVIRRQASLVAKWLHVGFIHGVMNTDNSTVSGETIDYGPCAFMDAYDANQVFSSIDRQGRYAYSNQPSIAQWNLARLAETLLPLIDPDDSRAIELATEAVNAFGGRFEQAWLQGVRAKLGLTGDAPGDKDLAQRLLALMHRTAADFTQTFRSLCGLAESDSAPQLVKLATDTEFAAWLLEWRTRLAVGGRLPAVIASAMRAVNPKYIPRNHRIEQAIVAAVEREDFSLFETLLDVVTCPFDEQPEAQAYAAEPEPQERVLQTFCGT
jgi:serine/tyrosine/threonine adenylyltransferase